MMTAIGDLLSAVTSFDVAAALRKLAPALDQQGDREAAATLLRLADDWEREPSRHPAIAVEIAALAQRLNDRDRGLADTARIIETMTGSSAVSIASFLQGKGKGR